MLLFFKWSSTIIVDFSISLWHIFLIFLPMLWRSQISVNREGLRGASLLKESAKNNGNGKGVKGF